MASQSANAEILIHVTAPSTTAHDVVYRQLAQAYLDFELYQRQDLPYCAAPAVAEGAVAGAGEPQRGLNAEPSKGEPAFGPDSQELSFQGVLDNRSSPRLLIVSPQAQKSHGLASSQPGNEAAQGVWQDLPSEIEDSYPLPDADLITASPTRILERYLQQSAPAPQSSSPKPPPAGDDHAAKPPSDGEQIDVPSSLPIPWAHERDPNTMAPAIDSRAIPMTPVSSNPRDHDRLQEQDASMLDVTHISASALSSASHPSEELEKESESPPPSKRPRMVQDESNVASSAMVPSSLGLPIPITQSESLDHVLEIQAPSPPASTAEFQLSGLVSSKLARLARELSSRYRPSIRRDLEPLERGFWRLDCAEWPIDTTRDLWLFLTKYIEAGHAGWGVRCCREATHRWLRVYCWAHIAKHIYLLLYIGSGRHLKYMPAEWVDADGEVALEVPPQEKPISTE